MTTTTSRFFSNEQIEKWKKDGYIVLSKNNGNCYFNDKEIENLLNWTNEIENWQEIPGKWMKYFEKSSKDGSRLLNRVENFFEYHDGFEKTFNCPKFLSLISELFEEPAVLFKEKINFKLPGGAGFEPHQDAQARWDMYEQTLHISVLVSLDEATNENGCLEIVAGQHKKGLLGPMDNKIADEVCQSLKWKSLHTKPGDLVFFDSYVPHRSGPNNSNHSRKILYVTYSKASEGNFRKQYFIDKRKNFPPDIERENEKEYKYKI